MLSSLDWAIIIGFLLFSLGIGVYSSRTSGTSAKEFFLSGQNMPWWMLGISMVATTFSADTPNLVTDIVRQNGISGNWVWWAFLLTGMLTVFIYARLWRRSGVLTDLEFYELRYSGKAASFLRGFRAFYLGVVFNVLVMATVCLAAIKIGAIMLGFTPLQTILIASIVTVFYSSLGGLRGIIFTDIFQFALAMIGTIGAAYFVVNMPEINGLSNLFAHEAVSGKLNIVPNMAEGELWLSLLIIPLAVQWWASYYPGAEPGGGGYIAQRMLAAKNEDHAVAATFLFNIAHYALRPWPWIIIALASLILFPSITSIQSAFPHVDSSLIKDDIAYPAMLTYLPKGLIGIVLASLIAAFMSTLSTHLNWGASYLTHDLYKRFIRPEANEKQLVTFGRISTGILMALAMIVALFLENAKAAFDIVVLVGAGTGLIFILRWFWWRINAYSEISAMISSFVVAVLLLEYFEAFAAWHLIINVVLTSVVWLVVTYLTRPTVETVLVHFYQKIKPDRLGWKPIADKSSMPEKARGGRSIRLGIMCMILGSILVYSALFFMGYLLMAQWFYFVLFVVVFLISAFLLKRTWSALNR